MSSGFSVIGTITLLSYNMFGTILVFIMKSLNIYFLEELTGSHNFRAIYDKTQLLYTYIEIELINPLKPDLHL